MQLNVSGLLKPFQRLLQGVLFPTLEQQVGPPVGETPGKIGL